VSPRNAKYQEQNNIRKMNRHTVSQMKNMVFTQARYNAAMIKWNKHMERIWKHGKRMGFNEDEITALKIEFDKYDEDCSGDIDLNELHSIVNGPAMNRPHLTRDDLKLMMNEFDYNNSGTITFAGFLEMMSPRRERVRNKYRNDLQELKARANVTNGLSTGSSIVFKSPRSPLFGNRRRRNNAYNNRGRRRNDNGKSTPRSRDIGTFGRTNDTSMGVTNDVNSWIEESRGASPKGRPPLIDVSSQLPSLGR
jgi:hypothetical protein